MCELCRQQTYHELYVLALAKIADVTPQAATKDECARAKAMVEAYYRGGLDRERLECEATKSDPQAVEIIESVLGLNGPRVGAVSVVDKAGKVIA